jgi:hypothetical protein
MLNFAIAKFPHWLNAGPCSRGLDNDLAQGGGCDENGGNDEDDHFDVDLGAHRRGRERGSCSDGRLNSTR